MRGITKYLILLNFIFIHTSIALAVSTAKIEAIGGAESVLVKRSGSHVKLKMGDQLQVGDELNTDALTAVDIRFEDNTILRVGLNSSYRFQEESKSGKFLHRLLQGAVRVLVPSKKDGNKTSSIKFKMQTPEGTIGVRGTEFVVIRKEGETNLKGLTGEVAFGTLEVDLENAKEDDKDLVKVTKGYESTIVKNAKAPTVPKPYPIKEYLRDLDSKSGIFGPLAERTGNETKMRSAVVEQPKMKALKVKPMKMASLSKPVVYVKDNKAKAVEGSKDYNRILMSAAKTNDLKMAVNAIENRANVNFRDEDGHTALHFAAYNNNLEMVQLLVDNKAYVNAKDDLGRTPIMNVALETGNVKVATLLVENGATLKDKDKQGLDVFDLANSNHDNHAWAELIDYLSSRK